MIRVISLILILIASPSYAVDYYVDFGRTTNGTGSEANPWKTRADIDWSAIFTSLGSAPVTIYFSSRATWNDDGYLVIPPNTPTTAVRTLTLDGHSKYNLTATGTAVWLAESVSSNRAILTVAMAGNSGGTVAVDANNQYITIKGFKIIDGLSGGMVLGWDNGAINIHDITLENNYVLRSGVTIGIGGPLLTSGVYNLTITTNTIENSSTECIYIGKYDYTLSFITDVIIEFNTCINGAVSGGPLEGDIDIKYPAQGAIVRNNTFYSGMTGRALAGIVIQADAVQAYANTIYNVGDGDCITINGDQGDAPGVTLNDIILYNNLCYTVDGSGFTFHANDTTGEGAGIVNLKILNNTIVNNAGTGVRATTSGGRTITISEFHNNIVSGNALYQVDIADSGGTITAANNNLYFGSGNILRYQGVNKTFAAWQMLGFDAQGLNVNPDLNGTTFVPNMGSPVINAGSTQTEFIIDIIGTPRPQSIAWDIGAYEVIISGSGNKKFGRLVP